MGKDVRQRLDDQVKRSLAILKETGSPKEAKDYLSRQGKIEAARADRLMGKMLKLLNKLDRTGAVLLSELGYLIAEGEIKPLPQGTDGIGIIDKKNKVSIRLKRGGKVKVKALAPDTDLTDIGSIFKAVSDTIGKRRKIVSAELIGGQPKVPEPKSVQRSVLIHKQWGVYLGEEEGERIWSKLVDRRWMSAKTFKADSYAVAFAKSIMPKLTHDDYLVRSVDTDATSGIVSLKAMIEAGYGEHVGDKHC